MQGEGKYMGQFRLRRMDRGKERFWTDYDSTKKKINYK